MDAPHIQLVSLGTFARLGSRTVAGVFHTGPKNAAAGAVSAGLDTGLGPSEIRLLTNKLECIQMFRLIFLDCRVSKGAKKLAAPLVDSADQKYSQVQRHKEAHNSCSGVAERGNARFGKAQMSF